MSFKRNSYHFYKLIDKKFIQLSQQWNGNVISIVVISISKNSYYFATYENIPVLIGVKNDSVDIKTQMILKASIIHI